jgi:uncharacterized protein (DUF983 family)
VGCSTRSTHTSRDASGGTAGCGSRVGTGCVDGLVGECRVRGDGSIACGFLGDVEAAPTCGHVATAANLRTGFAGFGIAALVLAAPWMLAALLVRRRWKPMIIGLAVTLLPSR